MILVSDDQKSWSETLSEILYICQHRIKVIWFLLIFYNPSRNVCMLKRIFDILLALILLPIILPLFCVISLMLMFHTGFNTLYWSDRVGRNNVIFKMPKFRTMRLDTPEVATHLLTDPEEWVTPIGKWLRKTSLDELPQIYNVLRGQMSWVGPRPALYNQDDLIRHRTEKQVHLLIPGLTGYAQINGRDSLSIEEKVAFDHFYLCHRSFRLDLKIIFLTLIKVLKNEGVAH